MSACSHICLPVELRVLVCLSVSAFLCPRSEKKKSVLFSICTKPGVGGPRSWPPAGRSVTTEAVHSLASLMLSTSVLMKLWDLT